MSLGIVIKGPEGLVLAAESRVTLTGMLPNGQELHVNFDNATKVLSFSAPNAAVGAVTFGLGAIGTRTAHSFIPEFEAELGSERLLVGDFAQALSDFFVKQWTAAAPAAYEGPDMVFVVAGFDTDEPYGRVFQFEIPKAPKPVEQFSTLEEFGLTWGGQREFVDRLIQGYDPRAPQLIAGSLGLDENQVNALVHELKSLSMPFPVQAMALQDCVDMALFFIRTTIVGQKLTVGIRGCGGPIDVAIITRQDGLRFIQRKQIVGEAVATP